MKTIFRLIDHYIERLDTEFDADVIEKYTEFIDYLTEVLLKDIFE